MTHQDQMTTSQRRRANRSYGAARSHSRSVTLLKWSLPVIAVVGLLGMGAQFYISRVVLPDDIEVDLAQKVIDGSNLVMANPEMTGTTSDNRPYSMTAERAVQSLTDPSAVALELIKADFVLREGVNARLISPEGSFNRDENQLDLIGPSVFSTDDGVNVEFDGADIDVENGNFLTNKPVQIVRNGTIINAGSMSITDHGKVVVFETDVRITIPPGAVPQTAAPARAQSAESTQAQ